MPARTVDPLPGVPLVSIPSPSAAPNKMAILAIILVSYVMIILDTSIVLTGLPHIARDLGFTDSGLAWVQSAYTLTFGGFLLLSARAGDILGRRRMLILGLAVFTVASVAIGMAQLPALMIAARAVQGLGSAILAPSTLALLQTTFAEGPERTRAVSWYSAVAGVAASVGLVMGGVLAQWMSWRVGFFVNLPIGVAMIVAARRYIVETGRRGGKFDIPGALTSTIGVGALVYGFIRSAEAGWGDAITLVAIAGALALLCAFVVIEKRAAQPIMPLRLFADTERAAAYLARLLFMGGMIGFFFFMTLYLQDELHYGATLTGLAFLPATIVNFIVAMMLPRLTRRFDNALLLAAGLTLCVTGMAWLSRATPDSVYLTAVALPMMLIGAGQGLTLGPLTVSGIKGVARVDAGAASGIVNVVHQIGSALGLAVLIAIGAHGAGVLQGDALTAHRVTVAFTTSTIMLALALLLAVAFIVPARSHKTTLHTLEKETT
jgi:EmrB/QacA subfamily drug resistance transporter